MSEMLSRSVDRLVEELIRVSQLTEWSKVKIVDGHVEQDAWSLTRDALRWFGKDSRLATRKHLEHLYEQVFETVTTLTNTYPLLNVLLPNSTALSSMEDQSYQSHKKWLDLLGMWIEKSATGLRHLHDSYEKKVPKFEMLADQSIQMAKEIRDLSAKLERAYAGKVKLPPLTSFSSASSSLSSSPLITSPSSSSNAIGSSGGGGGGTSASLTSPGAGGGGGAGAAAGTGGCGGGMNTYTVLSGHLSACRVSNDNGSGAVVAAGGAGGALPCLGSLSFGSVPPPLVTSSLSSPLQIPNPCCNKDTRLQITSPRDGSNDDVPNSLPATPKYLADQLTQ